MKKLFVFLCILSISTIHVFADLNDKQQKQMQLIFPAFEKNISDLTDEEQLVKIEGIIETISNLEKSQKPGLYLDVIVYIKYLLGTKYVDILSDLKGTELNKYLYGIYTSGIKEGFENISYVNNEQIEKINIYSVLINNKNFSEKNIVGAINLLRDDYNLPRLTYIDTIALAAKKHSEYLLANPKENYGLSAHRESPEGKKFYAVKASERMEKAGYKGYAWHEVISYDMNIIKSVKTLLDIPYHRVPFISPSYDNFGFSISTEDYGVMNFSKSENLYKNPASNIDDIIIYPKNEQIIYNYKGKTINENPDPFPKNSGIVGIVFSLLPSTSKIEIDDKSIILKDSSTGEIIPIIIAEKNDRDGTHFVNAQPLENNKKYEISFNAVDSTNNIIVKKSVFYTGKKK